MALAFAGCLSAAAQNGDLLLHDETYQLLDRLDIKGVVNDTSLGARYRGMATERKPIPREWIASWLKHIDSSGLRSRDRAWIERTRIRLDDDYAALRKGPGERWYQRGLFNALYPNRRDAFAVRENKFDFYVNPIVAASIGTERTAGTSASVYRRSIGAAVRGSFAKRVGFYADVYTTQVQAPAFQDGIVRATGALPGAPQTKPFGTGGYDYFEWRGYLTYTPADFLRIKFGHDRSFTGNGAQSLLLSDVATDYFQLMLTWRFWKLEYVNHFMQFTDFIVNKPDRYGAYPRKYGAFHTLTYRPVPEVSVSVFEAVIAAPREGAGFELQYLNPIIFYRAAEQALGSPDNSVLGFMVKANVWKRLQVSGQLMIDDYNFGARKGGSGWWGNKTGVQLSGKYIDVLGVETLDLQGEFNTIRPYAYSHYNVASNYTQYGQYLAHPLGANLRELAVSVSYQPIPRLYLWARGMASTQGLDENGLNYGANPLRTDSPIPGRSYGNTTGQGLKENLTVLQGRVTYQLWNSGLYFDLEGMLRKSNLRPDNTVILQAGLRLNLPNRPVLY